MEYNIQKKSLFYVVKSSLTRVKRKFNGGKTVYSITGAEKHGYSQAKELSSWLGDVSQRT